MKNTTEKAKLIYTGGTSFTLYIPPIFFTCYLIYFTISLSFTIDYLICLGLAAASWLFWFFFYYQKKIILTEHKVYIVKGKKKLYSISLVKDIETISFEQQKLGMRLGFGTLNIEMKDGNFVSYYFLSNPKATYERIIYTMETKFIKMDPDFKRTVEIENIADSINSDSLDSLDRIDKV